MRYPRSPPSKYCTWLQAQARTGRGKPRVWFVSSTETTAKQQVVKGPVDARERDACLTSQRYKELLGLPHTNMALESHAGHDYLVQDSLIDYTSLETRVVSTPYEKNVRVPILEHIMPWDHTYLKDASIAIQILEALLFRKVVGAHDTCVQNFMVIASTPKTPKTQKVYSIDDAALQKTTTYMWKSPLEPDIANQFKQALDQCWEHLQATMDRWSSLLCPQQDSFALHQLTLHREKSAWKW